MRETWEVIGPKRRRPSVCTVIHSTMARVRFHSNRVRIPRLINPDHALVVPITSRTCSSDKHRQESGSIGIALKSAEAYICALNRGAPHRQCKSRELDLK